jgi:hypothetical protein
MTSTTGEHRAFGQLSTSGRRTVRFVTAALSGAVGALYLVLLFQVAEAEAGRAENTFGAYLLLAVPYLAGAVLLLTMDLRALWIVGAAVQLLVLVLFVMFGAGAFGPGQGVFDYDALRHLPMELWAGLITGAEVLLLGLLGYLALVPATLDEEA